MTAPSLRTSRLKLVPKTVADARAMVEAMSPADRQQLSADWLGQVYSEAPVSSWLLGFSIVEQASGRIIGHCGFKGPPAAAGVVELAYGLAPESQGQGYATEAAQVATAYALGTGEVRTVIAHTLSATDASSRVLRKVGFKHCGEVMDPDDGLVQRWERSVAW